MLNTSPGVPNGRDEFPRGCNVRRGEECQLYERREVESHPTPEVLSTPPSHNTLKEQEEHKKPEAVEGHREVTADLFLFAGYLK